MTGADFLSHVALPVGLVILSSVITLVIQHYRGQSDTTNEVRKSLNARITELERQLSVLSVTVQPLSVAFQTMLIKQLTHFHTPKLDKLLAGLGPPFTLSVEDEAQLLVELTAREHDLDDTINDSERDAARMLPMVIKRVREDAAAVTDLHGVKGVVNAARNPETGKSDLIVTLVKDVSKPPAAI